MKKTLLLLFVFSCLNALAQGKIVGLQEVTDDDGTYYYHDIPTDGTDLRIVRTSVQEPEKDPAIVPFLKKWSIVAKVEGEDIESVKFTLTSTSGGGIQGLGFKNTFIDNEPPYSAFGDENGIFETFFSEDPYFAIVATPYTEDNAQGTELQGASSYFSTIDYNNELGPTLQIIDKETNEVLVETTAEESKTVDYNLVKDKSIFLQFSKGTGRANFNVKISKDNEVIRISAPPLLNLMYAQWDFTNLVFTSGNYNITAESRGRNRTDWLAGRRDISTSWNINFVDNNTAKTYIPDDNFEQALIDLGYDDVLDDYVLTENIENVTELNFNNKDITDFTGLNDFTSLETFSGSLSASFIGSFIGTAGNSVQIDVSELVNLTDFSCTNCALLSLDLTNNINLERVNISANEISEIDISTLTKLKSFFLGAGNLTTLDVTNNTLLENLGLSTNSLTTLDVSQNSSLQFLSTLGNDAPGVTCIQVANIEDALAQERWFVDNPANYSLDCNPPADTDGDGVTDDIDICPETPTGESVNTTGCSTTELTYVPDNNFEQALINLGYDDVLDDYVATNKLEEISELSLINLNISNLTGLEAMPKLRILLVENDEVPVKIENIDLSKNVNLERLLLYQTLLESIDVRNNINLKILDIPFNELKEIDLSKNTELTELYLTGNPLETLDVSELTKLVKVNIQLIDNLYCIKVSDQQDTSSWRKDDTATFSTDCTAIGTDTDDDGVVDENDQCPNTPTGELVNAEGCSLSQYADIAVQNVSISLGSFLCSEPQNCTVDVAVMRDVDIEVSVVKDETEIVFDGKVGISNPLSLENLTEGEYSVCATRSDIPNFVQCYQVSSTATENSIRTNIVMQNPGQVYSLAVEGNRKYEVLVNDNSAVYEFDTVEKQNIEIPLEVGPNTIQIIGEIDCGDGDSEEMEDDKSIDSLLLFPTLSDGLITIENNKKHQIHGITVTGLSGKTTKYILINGNPKEMKIDMKGAAKGMYIVRIQQASGEAVLKKILIR